MPLVDDAQYRAERRLHAVAHGSPRGLQHADHRGGEDRQPGLDTIAELPQSPGNSWADDLPRHPTLDGGGVGLRGCHYLLMADTGKADVQRASPSR